MRVSGCDGKPCEGGFVSAPHGEKGLKILPERVAIGSACNAMGQRNVGQCGKRKGKNKGVIG